MALWHPRFSTSQIGVGVCILFMLLVISIVAREVDAEEAQKGPRILASDGKIAFTRYIGLGRSDDLDTSSFTFLIVNNGNETANGLKVLQSSLVEKERGKFSTAPSYIGFDNIVVSLDHSSLGPEEQAKGTYTIGRPVLDAIGVNEITYQGRIQVMGDKFSPVTLDVEVKFIDVPYVYFFVAWIGVGIAIAIGFLFSLSKKKDEIEKDLKDDIKIILGINKHIQNINILRNTVTTTAWENIYSMYVKNAGYVLMRRDDFNLDSDLEEVQWFEKMDEMLLENKSIEAPPKPIAANIALMEIVIPDVKDPIYNATIDDLTRQLKWDFLRQSRKEWAYLAGTLLAASVAAVITSASFVGNSYANVLVAISFGFAIYRAQDLLKGQDSNKDSQKDSKDQKKDSQKESKDQKKDK